MKELILLALGVSLATVGRAAEGDGSTNPRVVLETSKGAITVELDPAKAPKTVENFLAYVESGFFDGTIFHRVIPGFMVQGGGFELKDQKLSKKTTAAPIKNEASNGLLNKVGTIAMARTSVRDSATSQFFINVNHNRSLDGGYAVFGEVTKGMDVVNKIVAKPRGTGSLSGRPAQDVPKTPIIIHSVRRAN